MICILSNFKKFHTTNSKHTHRSTINMSSSTVIVHVLIFPFPAQGHMIPILDFADDLSSHDNLTVTIFVTPANLPLLQPLLTRSPAIKTLVLPFPSHPSIPSGMENLKGLPPGYFFPMMYALGFLHNPLLDWARKSSNPPDFIVSDFFLGWTNRLAHEIGIPRVVFSPSGAFTLSTLHHLWKEMPKKETDDVPDSDYTMRFSNIPGSPEFPWSQISSIFRRYVNGDVDSEFIRDGFVGNSESWGQVINTFEDLEGVYLDHLRKELRPPSNRVWAVGPLGTGTTNAKDRGGTRSAVSVDNLVSWLDSCPDRSVVYICFGSQAVLNQTQTEVLTAAIRLSGSRFVWVVGTNTSLDDGEMMVGRGIVIRGWAPQVAILNHPAVGSFLTHCGWNSMLEAVSAGVISLAWPMRADQFIDARLLLELGIGIKVCEGEDAVPDVKELGRVMSESTSGKLPDVEKKVREFKRKALESVATGGSSSRSMNRFVQELLHVVKKKKGLMIS